MKNYLDHIIYLSPDLETSNHDFYAKTGIVPSFGGRHEKFNTHNSLISLGDKTYFEILAREESTLESKSPIEKFESPFLQSIAVGVGDIQKTAHLLQQYTSDYIKNIADGSRQKTDGSSLKWKTSTRSNFNFNDVQNLPFLIEWDTDAHPAQTSATGCTLLDIKIYTPDFEVTKRIYSSLEVNIDIVRSDQNKIEVTLDTPKGNLILT